MTRLAACCTPASSQPMDLAAFKATFERQLIPRLRKYESWHGLLKDGISIPGQAASFTLKSAIDLALRDAMASLRNLVEDLICRGRRNVNKTDLLDELMLLRDILVHAESCAAEGQHAQDYRFGWVVRTSLRDFDVRRPARAKELPTDLACFRKELELAAAWGWTLLKLIRELRRDLRDIPAATENEKKLRNTFFKQSAAAEQAAQLRKVPKVLDEQGVFQRVELMIKHMGAGNELKAKRERFIQLLRDRLLGMPSVEERDYFHYYDPSSSEYSSPSETDSDFGTVRPSTLR